MHCTYLSREDLDLDWLRRYELAIDEQYTSSGGKASVQHREPRLTVVHARQASEQKHHSGDQASVADLDDHRTALSSFLLIPEPYQPPASGATPTTKRS